MSNARLEAIFGKFEADNDGEILNAVRFATKAIKSQGLTWVQVAQMIENANNTTDAVQFARMHNEPLRDIFSYMNENFKASQDRQAQAQARAEEAERRAERKVLKIVQGKDIPSNLYGLVDILEEREWKEKKTVLVTITNLEKTICYGPLKVWDEEIVEKMIEAAKKTYPQVVTVAVRPARDERYSPNIVHASLDGLFIG